MKKSRKRPSPEQKAAAQARRAALIARSVPLQAARKAGRLPWAQLPTVNACLELIYASETNQTEWRTFQGWREMGFGVRKGEQGFAIWGRPIGGRPAAARDGVDGDAAATDERAFEFYPVSYLFHAGQVADADGHRPSGCRTINAFAEAVAAAPLALPAPADSEPREGQG